MGRIVYWIKEAFRGIVQAKLMTSVSVVAIAVSLFLLGVVIITVLNVREVFSRALTSADLVVYLDEAAGADSAALHDMARTIAAREQVDSIYVMSKESARERFVLLYGEEMLDAVEGNPLPASIEVTLHHPWRGKDAAAAFAAQVRGFDGVESVDFSPEWFERLSRFRSWMVGGALALGVLCLVVLQFIVSNTVKLTIYARKDLVVNMRYVGATDFSIAVPFVLEGVLQGALGGLAGTAGLWLVQVVMHRFLITWGEPWVLPSLLFVGVSFGWAGGVGAVRKFLV